MKRISYPYFFDCAATPKRLQLSLTQTTAACLSTRTFSRSIVESKDLLPTILQNAMLQEKKPKPKNFAHSEPRSCYPGPILGLRFC